MTARGAIADQTGMAVATTINAGGEGLQPALFMNIRRKGFASALCCGSRKGDRRRRTGQYVESIARSKPRLRKPQ